MRYSMLFSILILFCCTILSADDAVRSSDESLPLDEYGLLAHPDQWLQEQIRNDVKAKKDWKWVIAVPPAKYFPTFSVKANGKQAEVIKFQEISYTDLPAAKSFQLEISASVPIKSVNVSPHSYGLTGTIKDGKFHLALDRPRQLILTFNGNYRLLLFANGATLHPIDKSAKNVINFADSNADRSGRTDETAKLQKAIDLASEKKGVLYIPKGTYRFHQLMMKSNMTLWLERGAILKTTDDPAIHHRFYEENLKKGIQFTGGLVFYKVENVSIAGNGTIDGNGDVIGRKIDFTQRGHYRLIHTIDSKNITVTDVILKNPPRWNSHLANTQNIRYENVKIINSINISNTDAIDPDNSVDVLVKNVFAYCSDDTIAIKTSARWHDGTRPESSFLRSKNITVRDCVFWTRANAMKLGTETFRDVENVLFENNDIIHAYSMMVIEVKEGGKMNNIRFINNRVEELGDVSKSRFIHFLVREFIYTSQKATAIERPSYGMVTNVQIKDFFAECESQSFSRIQGCNATSRIDNVEIDNFVLKGKRITVPADINLRIGEFTNNIKIL